MMDRDSVKAASRIARKRFSRMMFPISHLKIHEERKIMKCFLKSSKLHKKPPDWSRMMDRDSVKAASKIARNKFSRMMFPTMTRMRK